MTKDDAAAHRKRAETTRYEGEHDVVPGTASHVGGGLEWEGAARMALARLPEDRTDRDREALRRHPSPRSSMTGAPMLDRPLAEIAAGRLHASFGDERVAAAAAATVRARADLT